MTWHFPLELAPNLSHSLLLSVGLGTHGAYRKAKQIQAGDFSVGTCLYTSATVTSNLPEMGCVKTWVLS